MNTTLKYQEQFFDLYIKFSYFLIIVSFLGISILNKEYIDELDNIIKLYISLFLIWRFHPLKNGSHFGSLDRKLAFSAGILLLTTTFLNDYIISIKQYVLSFFNDKIAKKDNLELLLHF